MSTTFDVYPGNAVIPTFADVIELAQSEINAFLSRYTIGPIELSVSFMGIDFLIDANRNRVAPALNEPFCWDGEEGDPYAWFHIPKINGGTDVYCRNVGGDSGNATFYRTLLIESVEAECSGGMTMLGGALKNALAVGRYWTFRRSAGQPGVINLSYGMLAAALAKLTDGVVYSEDSAWPSQDLPKPAEHFFSAYFRPELSSNLDEKAWFSRCIERIPKEIWRR